ncbi:hypothetical protein Tco_0564102 [Tanacetum coccineum]
MDSHMDQFGYEARKTNYYYFLKPSSNLIDGLYNLRETVNYELLKDLVNEHKMIDIYVENGKTRLEIIEMSPNSIITVFREMDEDSRKPEKDKGVVGKDVSSGDEVGGGKKTAVKTNVKTGRSGDVDG